MKLAIILPIALALFLTPGTSILAANELPPMSESYLVLDLTNSVVIAQKNAATPRSIASITKLMNAVVSLENTNMDKTTKLTKDMLRPVGYSPSLFLGLTVSAKNLLRASLIQSVNDAAESLASFVGKKKFIGLMNQKAKELGMTKTVFYDAHGLNMANQSSAQDIAKLLAYINTNHPEILTITKENGFQLPDPTGRLLTFKNLNVFYEKPEFIGGKSGFLPKAKQSFASLFSINGKTVAIVTLKSDKFKADVLKLIELASL